MRSGKTATTFLQLKTEGAIRTWLERERRRPVSDDVWDKLRAKRLVDACLQHPSNDTLATLVGWADLLTRSRRQSRRHSRQKTPEIWLSELDQLETERSRVFSNHLARVAANDFDVQRLRNDFLGGRVLSRSDAYRLLDSDAARVFPHAFFKTHGIPLAPHLSKITERDPPHDEDDDPSYPQEVILIAWSGGRTHEEPVGRDIRGRILKEGIPFPSDPDDRNVLPGSVLDEIREVTLKLAKLFVWEEPQAVMFLLAGEVPFISSISYHPVAGTSADHSHCPVELRILPWVSPRSVHQAYRSVQKAVYGSKHKPICLRNLQLFEFVTENYSRGKVTWTDLWDMWNSEHREWCFKDYRALRQEFERYRKQIEFDDWFAKNKLHPEFYPPTHSTSSAESCSQTEQRLAGPSVQKSNPAPPAFQR